MYIETNSITILKSQKHILIIPITIALALAAYLLTLRDYTPKTRVQQANSRPEVESMTFTVLIPDNTPANDHILFFSKLDIKGREMTQIGPRTYSLTLRADEFGLTSGTEIRYRYTRNRIHLAEAEYISGLPNEDNNYFFGVGLYENAGLGRTTTFSPGKIQNDTIERWRWFAAKLSRPETITELLPHDPFLPRFNSMRFLSGQGIWDLYTSDFDQFNTITAQHMKKIGYEWVVIYPPWQWLTEEPLPRAGNMNDTRSGSLPNYTDEQLIRQIQAFKAEGIKVIVAPQISNIDTNDRSIEWWQAYWQEMKRLLTYHAKLAQQARADAFLPYFLVLGLSRSHSAQVMNMEQTAWKNIFSEVERIFSGEIGQLLMIWKIEDGLSPDLNFIVWNDKVDFYMVFTNAILSKAQNPEQTELTAAASKILDATKTIWNAYQKPIIIHLSTHSIKASWKTSYSYPLGVCGEETSDTACPYEFSAYDQARVVHAFFESLRTRPWVSGLLQFGYGLWELPLIREWNIRGKAADRVWQQWNRHIFK